MLNISTEVISRTASIKKEYILLLLTTNMYFCETPDAWLWFLFNFFVWLKSLWALLIMCKFLFQYLRALSCLNVELHKTYFLYFMFFLHGPFALCIHHVCLSSVNGRHYVTRTVSVWLCMQFLWLYLLLLFLCLPADSNRRFLLVCWLLSVNEQLLLAYK